MSRHTFVAHETLTAADLEGAFVDVETRSAPALALAQNTATTTGLDYGYHGGTVGQGDDFTAVVAGTVALTANTTNYVEVDRVSGVVSDNTVGFSGGTKSPLAVAVTGASSITSVVDRRSFLYSAGGDVTGPISSVAANFAAFAGTDGKTLVDSGVTLTPDDVAKLALLEYPFRPPLTPCRVATWDAPGDPYTLPAHSRVGNTLTADEPGAFPIIDDVECEVGDRILIRSEGGLNPGISAENGVYVLTVQGDEFTPWELQRAADADTADKLVGRLVAVQFGTQTGGNTYQLQTAPPIVLNTTGLNFVVFSYGNSGVVGPEETNTGNLPVWDNETGRALADSGIAVEDIVLDDDERLDEATEGGPGLMPALSGDDTEFLAGDGTWKTPAGGGGGGAEDFTDLGDVPADYSGAAGKLVAVNGSGDGLEFVAPTTGAGGGEFTVATVPDPATRVGQTIFVSDGASGSPCAAFSNGVNWLRFTLGALIAEFAPDGLAGMVAWLRHATPSSGSTWTDSSPEDNDATLYNGADWSGGDVVCDGTNDYIEISNSATTNLDSIDAVSVAMWIKLADASTNKIFAIKYLVSHGDGNGRWWFSITDDKIVASATDGVDSKSVTSSTTILDDTWYHIALVWVAGNTMKLYINGVQEGGTLDSGVPDISAGSGPISIGRYSSTYTPLTCREFTLYNEELTGANVAALAARYE